MTTVYAGTIREVSAITSLSARTWNAQPREAMISITGSGEPPVRLRKGWTATLRLQFDDIEVAVPGRKLFGEEDADKVIDFIEKIEGKVDHVVVHCTHGQSRAPGIARFITIRNGLSNGFRLHPSFNRHVFRTLFWRWRHRVAPGQGGSCDMGYCRPDDPVYQLGLMVSGRQVFAPYPEPKKKE